MRTRRVAGAAAFACVAVLLGLLAPAALGLEPSEEREAYVERAEPVCKTNVLANRRIFKGAKQEVKAGKLKQASRHFSRAATAFGKTIRELAAIPRPAADAPRLGKWLTLLRKEKAIIGKIGEALRAGDKHRAQSYSVELNRNSNKANNAVLGFGFNYCRIEPSRFG